MKSFLPEKQQRKKRSRFLEILVAVLIIIVLVGSMAFLFKTRQSSLASRGTPTTVPATPTPSPMPAVTSQDGLYVTTSNGIERISLTSGKVAWHSGSGTTDSLLIDHGIVVVASGDTFGGPNNSSNYYIEAVNAATGKQIWRKPYPGIIYPLQGANGIAYVSSCGAADTATCSIEALKVSNGNRLWSYTSNLGTIWDLYQNGVVYGINYSRFFALNATTGAILWQKTLQKYPYQDANMTPVVSGKGLYFATCNETKQTPTYQSCYFFAFNATNGEELWHISLGSNMNNNILALPTVMDGVVYTASFGGVIHAFNAATGATLWTYATGGQIVNPLLSSQGLLYVEVQNTTSTRLLALKVTVSSHSTAWSQNLNVPEGAPGEDPLVLENGQLHILDSHRTILSFQATSGDRAQSYSSQTGVSITSFSFVSQNAG